MRPLRSGLAIGTIGLLSACFMSETPFIPDADAVRLGEGTILVCSDADDCSHTIPDEDGMGYMMMPPPDEDDEPIAVKFAPLMDTSIGPVWLAEIDMTEEDERAYVVGVVRRAPEYDQDGVAAFDVELPWCEDIDDAELAAYGIERLDSYTCSMPAKTSISDYLRQTHKEEFETPEWWEDD